MKAYFSEVQKFSFTIIWVIILAISGLIFYGFYQQIILGMPFGNNPAPDILLIIFVVVFGVGFPVLFFNIKLITTVDDEGLKVKYVPFHFRYIVVPLKQIKEFKRRTYRPFKEFGGWGIRWEYKIKAYTVSGKEGVEIEFNDGKKLLIGSQKADELFKSLSHLKIKIPEL